MNILKTIKKNKSLRHKTIAQILSVVCVFLAIGIAARDYLTSSNQTPLSSEPSSTQIVVADSTPVQKSNVSADAASITLVSQKGPIEDKRLLQVEKGDTMASLLTDAGIGKEDAYQAIESLKAIYNPKNLKVGQIITVHYRKENETAPAALISLRLQSSIEQEVSVTQKDPGKFNAQKHQIDLDKVLKRITGRINSSFYQAALAKGVPAEVVKSAITALSCDVNWQHDTKVGDYFEVVYYEYVNRDGKSVKCGDLEYVAFSPKGNLKQAYRFQPVNSNAGYYNAKGESVVKALLKNPIDGAKISSRFGLRMHPIKRFTCAHKGIDFRAKKGTPVVSAGDGRVVRAGYYGNYGKYVLIKHSSDYSTAYAHLSTINVKVGDRVTQGKVIGGVGSTGNSTGNHLHHEVIYRGKQVDPLKIKQLPTKKLDSKDLKHFLRVKNEIHRKIASITPQSQFADLGSAEKATLKG